MALARQKWWEIRNTLPSLSVSKSHQCLLTAVSITHMRTRGEGGFLPVHDKYFNGVEGSAF